MSPRADFECQQCQSRYEDLPVQCVRCPVCNRKRGFRRLFDAVHVAAKPVAAFVDPLIRPALERRDELANARAAVRRDQIRMVPAGTAMGAVDAGGRAVSRAYHDPHLAAQVQTVPVFSALRGRGPRPGPDSRSG